MEQGLVSHRRERIFSETLENRSILREEKQTSNNQSGLLTVAVNFRWGFMNSIGKLVSTSIRGCVRFLRGSSPCSIRWTLGNT